MGCGEKLFLAKYPPLTDFDARSGFQIIRNSAKTRKSNNSTFYILYLLYVEFLDDSKGFIGCGASTRSSHFVLFLCSCLFLLWFLTDFLNCVLGLENKNNFLCRTVFLLSVSFTGCINRFGACIDTRKTMPITITHF